MWLVRGYVGNELKIIYKTVIRPIVVYVSEVWKLNTKEEHSLEIFERKVLRKIYGRKEEGEVWLRRTNEKLMRIYGEPLITNVTRVQRLRWLGDVGRLERRRETNEKSTNGEERKRQTSDEMATSGGKGLG
ncbi:uncharacterized protein LOC108916522 [Anoplophora glabripennis]|uniref:uncharacterized protein LOC108916522 n=1 Tax=Anoplophora glabripennis TaxID=217634 RepID=UPI0008744315|nr:uncharacterized protein LOC108916522 [Anoplophora glabripennis]